MRERQLLVCLTVLFLAKECFQGWSVFGDAAPSGPSVQHHVHEHHVKESESLESVNAKLFSRIETDLDLWKDGISLDMVERTYCTVTSPLFRVQEEKLKPTHDYVSSLRMQIVDGEVYFLGEMEGFMEFHRMAKLFILDVYQKHKLPDVDLVLTTFDNCPDQKPPIFGENTRCKIGAPLFTFSRQSHHAHCVLFPTFSFGPGGWPLAKIPAWDTFMKLMNTSDHLLKPWEHRLHNLFFRGAPTGVREDIIGRLRELDFGQVAMDARLTGWTGLTNSHDYVSLPGHCDYKYLLSLPGNGYASRLRYLMRCGSVPLFYDNGVHEFWYHAMENNVHSVKLNVNDPSEGAKAIWQATKDLEANPQLAAAIANNSQRFVEEILNLDNVERYFVELLNKYSKLQTFKPQIDKDAVHIRYSAMGPDSTYRVETRNCSFCMNPPAR